MNGKIVDFPKKCFICGNTKNLTKTPCCNQWICNDESNYVLFSFAHNSCFRNHSKYTLCGVHYAENHKGKWWNCVKCKEIDPEYYADAGTNSYNNLVLVNPPSFKLQRCYICKKPVKRPNETYTETKEGIICSKCRP